jgi:type IV pilus assembly protein PilB
MSEDRVGELLIAHNLISRDQFLKALELQKTCPEKPIGQLLCQLGFLQEAVLKEILDYKGKRQKMGEILMRMKLIDERKLNNALSMSKQEKVPLGRALVKLHYIEEEQLARCIALQYDLPFVSIDRFSFDTELSKLFNFQYANIHKIVPVSKIGKTLTLAMAFPLDGEEILAVESASGMRINPVIAMERDIKIALKRIYKMQYDVAAELGQDELEYKMTEELSSESVDSQYADQFIGPVTNYLVKRILFTGIKEGASDIHFESTEYGMAVRFRIDGVLQVRDFDKDGPAINDHAKQIISKVKIISELDIAEKRRPQDGSFKMKVSKDDVMRAVDFRVSTIPTQYGENVVIRILDKRSLPMSLDALGLSHVHVEVLERELQKPTGIFLVTGPTGSGKSTTLYSILTRLNTPEVKTVTVEDPIEYTIDGISQSEVNDVVGNSFAKLLRSFLRQDPDNIMIGEIRDVETASIAIRAAMTGHTVLSTLHTNDATSTITRLLDMGIDASLLSSTIRCILSQRLVRIICEHCKVRQLPSERIMKEFLMAPGASPELYSGKGCVQCNYSGYSKRKPIVELWAPTREEILQIHCRPDNHALRALVFHDGRRITLLEDGIERMKRGETTAEELLHVVPYEQVEEFRAKVLKKKYQWAV